jgi:hypothetical protein
MPVFDFKKRWLDLNWQYVSPDKNSSAGDPTDPGPSAVASAYLWIYIIVAGIITGATVRWWWYVKRDLGDSEDSEGLAEETSEKVVTATPEKGNEGATEIATETPTAGGQAPSGFLKSFRSRLCGPQAATGSDNGTSC